MAELGGNVALALLRTVLIIFILTVLVVITMNFGEAISNLAAKHCPPTTFAHGRAYGHWDGWAVTIFVLGPFFALMNIVVRSPLFSAGNREKFTWRWTRYTTSAFVLFTAAAGCAAWVTSSAQICLADSGIYRQTLPWQTFHRYRWANVARVDVSCRNRRKEPDLTYTLTTGDGTHLDLSDVLNRRAFPQFRMHMTHMQFAFSASVDPSCPDWYSDWVGKRP